MRKNSNPIFRGILVLAVIAVFPSVSLATGYTGLITNVSCSAATSKCTLYTLDGDRTGTVPECANNTPNYYTFIMNSTVFKEQFSIALAAQASGKGVIVSGVGQCDNSANYDIEGIEAITLSN